MTVDMAADDGEERNRALRIATQLARGDDEIIVQVAALVERAEAMRLPSHEREEAQQNAGAGNPPAPGLAMAPQRV